MNDDQSVQKINWNTMRRLIVSSSDLSDSSVGSKDYNGCLVGLECSVKEREALDVQHVNLIDEQNTWNQIRLVLLLPLSNLLINLISYFRSDFSSLSREQSHKSLGPRVNHIDVMKRHSMNNLFPLKNLSFWTLSKPCLRRNSIKLRGLCKTSSKSVNLSTCLVNSNDISSCDFLSQKSFDHFSSQIINGLHVGGLEGQLTHFVSLLVFLYFQMNNFSFNNLSFLFNSNSNRPSKCLS